jgi:Leucine-rich repeat (LRR) protein
LILPDSLKYFACSNNRLTSFEGLILPDSVIDFDCSNNGLTSFEGFTLPHHLLSFNCSNNSLTSLEGLILPDSLVDFDCSNNQLTSEYYNDNGRIKSMNEINEISYKWRVNKASNIINNMIKDKKAREIQNLWKNYWLTPTKIQGYDYPVSRYMIYHKHDL